MKKAELFNDCKNHLGEGVLWSKQQETLYWLDVPMPSRLFKLNMKNKEDFEVFKKIRDLKDNF